MFDVGEKKFLRLNPQTIFITHLHPDHAFFARLPHPSSPSMRGRIKEGVKIFAPEKYRDYPQVKIISKSISIGEYKITPLPTIHSKNVKSQAYLIEAKGRRLLYTGDMIWIKKRYWPRLKNLDLVITEGSFIKAGGMIQKDESGLLWGHQGIPDLIKFFRRFTKKIIITHFGSWFYKDINESKKELLRLGTENGIEVMVGYDEMKISI
jgi:ribonuclease BN (tRNA processing enzyme)